MAGPDKSRVIIFNSDGMGRTDTPELPQVLASGFLALLVDARLMPSVSTPTASSWCARAHRCWPNLSHLSKKGCA